MYTVQVYRCTGVRGVKSKYFHYRLRWRSRREETLTELPACTRDQTIPSIGIFLDILTVSSSKFIILYLYKISQLYLYIIFQTYTVFSTYSTNIYINLLCKYFFILKSHKLNTNTTYYVHTTCSIQPLKVHFSRTLSNNKDFTFFELIRLSECNVTANFSSGAQELTRQLLLRSNEVMK